MSTRLSKRIDSVEKVITPKNDFLFVIVKDDDASIEAAKARAMQEHGIDRLSDDCFIFVINLFSMR